MACPDEVSGTELTIEEFDSSRIKVEADTDPEIEENVNPSPVSSSESKEGLLTSAPGLSSVCHLKDYSVTVLDGEAIFKCSTISVCCIGTMAKILESNPPLNFSRRARLMEDNRYSVYTHIARLRDLLEEYALMAANRKSVNCAHLRCAPKMIYCSAPSCGQMFTGSGTHLLELLNHITSSHAADAKALTLNMMKKFRVPLMRMGEMLHEDKKYIAMHYL